MATLQHDTVLPLTKLPPEVLEHIFSYISYDEVSRFRSVCKMFDIVATRILNFGFNKVENYHSNCLQKVKALLPRRESERRKHPLARHSDILTAVETRLSLLRMTFMKYVDFGLCCFIPGKVLDEIFRVLRYVSTEKSPVRAHEVLQELRDLSSMAMEHFDEKIAPSLKTKSISVVSFKSYHVLKSNHPSKYSKMFNFLKYLHVKYGAANKKMNALNQKVIDLNNKNLELEKKLADQQSLMDCQKRKIKVHDLKLKSIINQFEEHQTIVNPILYNVLLKAEESDMDTIVSVRREMEMADEETVVSEKRKLGLRSSSSSDSGDNPSKKIKK